MQETWDRLTKTERPLREDEQLSDGGNCSVCGGRMIVSTVAVYCENAFYDKDSECDNKLMCG